MPTLLNKTIRLFLDSIGRREEYEFYLRKFSTDQTPAFALICPDHAGFAETASVFAFDLNSLLRLELHPAILLAGDHAEEMLAVLQEDSHLYSVHEWESSAVPDERVGAAAAFLQTCLRDSRIGIITATGQELGDVLAQLVPPISRRVHVVRNQGAVHSCEGEPLTYLYLNRADDYDLDNSDRELVAVADRLLTERPGTHISVCSPWNLLQELFTVKGAGCVIRRGSEILRLRRGEPFDRQRLVTLLEESFRRSVREERVLGRLEELYVESEYRGAVLLEQHSAGLYLSKFAVGTEARGEGLANELWREVSRNHSALFWRARLGNPVNQWYERRVDGWHSEAPWRVFWRGIAHAAIPDVIDFCLNREDDFVS